VIKPAQSAHPNAIYFILLLVPLFWGGAFGTTKHVVTEVPPITVAALRFLLAGLLMTVWVAARDGWNWAPVRRRWGGLLLLGITGVLGYNYFFTVGIQYTSAINAALVVVVNPVTTAIVAVTLLGEPWSWRLVAGVTLCFLGVLTTISKGSLALLSSLTFSSGDLFMVGAVISWTAYTTVGKVVMKDVPPLLATSASTVAGSFMLLAASLTEDGWALIPAVSTQVAWEIAYLVVFPTVVAFFLFNVGIKRIGASRASAYINLMPVNAIWIAAVLYGETVTLAHLAGAALIIGGLLLITLFDVRPAPSPGR
jgi:drug/metabolite transporter (DMT)-like permease